MAKKKEEGRFWIWVTSSLIFRLLLIYFPKNLNLASRPEISTPLTSLRRLAEGYWLKQSSLSLYAGSMYHGSPLLLSVLGPLTVERIGGQPNHLLSTLPSRDIAALVYLWNPFTIVACVGLLTSPIENLAVIFSLYGACTGRAALAAFGWVMATHLSLYPVILIIPLILLLGYGPDTSRKLFLQRRYGKMKDNPSSDSNYEQGEVMKQPELLNIFSWRPVVNFLVWSTIWSIYVLVLRGIYVKQYGGIQEMFKRTYGFVLTMPNLSPSIGVLWCGTNIFSVRYFEIGTSLWKFLIFFRNFFLIVFHMNILFMILPLVILFEYLLLLFTNRSLWSPFNFFATLYNTIRLFGLVMTTKIITSYLGLAQAYSHLIDGPMIGARSWCLDGGVVDWKLSRVADREEEDGNGEGE
ncbi:hypothetical protein UlMin_035572 [Ulmus minor]